MTDHIRVALASCRAFRVACVPNAGLPDENGSYLETPEMIAAVLARFVREGLAQPRRRLLRHARRATSRRSPSRARAEAARARRRTAKLALGHRLPGDHRRQCARCSSASAPTRSAAGTSRSSIVDGKFEEASEIARRAGEERRPDHRRLPRRTPTATSSTDMRRFLEIVIKKVRVPLMIDSTDDKVIDDGAHVLPGQGDHQLDQPRGRRGALREGRAARPALRRRARRRLHRRGHAAGHGRHAASASSRSRERSLRPARRTSTASRRRTSTSIRSSSPAPRATRSTSAPRSRPSRACGSSSSASPRRKTVLGISNVSFGLPAAGREVLNSVFLYHCVQGRARSRHRQRREARALRRDPRGGEEARGGRALGTGRRRSDRRLRRALPRAEEPASKAELDASLDERLARCIVEGSQGRPDRRPRREAEDARRRSTSSTAR